MFNRLMTSIQGWLALTKATAVAAAVIATEAKEAKERATIARHFNNRYTHRVAYDLKAPIGLDRAWMCPNCNKVHASFEFSFLSGMQYPACCAHFRGHRHFDGISH